MLRNGMPSSPVGPVGQNGNCVDVPQPYALTTRIDRLFFSALLRSSRLFLLEDLNIHRGTGCWSSPGVHEFSGIHEPVPTCYRANTFGRTHLHLGPDVHVWVENHFALSWSDHPLLRFGFGAFPLGGVDELIRRACPWRLLDAIGFQNVFRVFGTDLVGTPVKSQVPHHYLEVNWAVDTIAPKCPLWYRAQCPVIYGKFEGNETIVKTPREEMEESFHRMQPGCNQGDVWKIL